MFFFSNVVVINNSQLFSIIVFGCISSQGWLPKNEKGKEECLYNGDSNACNYGVGISVIAFLASMGFLVGEFLFEQMSSVKTRKHYVLADLAFSGKFLNTNTVLRISVKNMFLIGFWAFLYFVGFWYLANQWGKANTPPGGYGVSNVRAAIAFCFFSIFTWAGCAYFAFQRFRQGADAAFATNYEADTTLPSSYPGDADQHYQEAPFSNQRNVGGDFQPPAY